MLDHAGLRPAVPRPAAGKPFELAPTVVRWSDANYIEDRDHWYHAGVRTAARYVFGSRTRRAEIDAGNVEPWSAESPRLFDLDVQLFDADGKKVDGVVARVGFRRVEVRGRNC